MRYTVIFLVLIIPIITLAQDSVRVSKKSSMKRAVLKLSSSFEQDSSDDSLAYDYELLAHELANKGEYEKAENYLVYARKLYERLNNREKQAFIEREIGKMQEAQHKPEEAIESYKKAGQLSSDKRMKEINRNDLNRLKNSSNPVIQSSYIQKNIDLLNTSGNQQDFRDDRVTAFQQMAEVNLQMNKKEEAIGNYTSVLSEVKDQPKVVIKTQQEIANVYASDSQYEKAIDINKKLAEEAVRSNDTVTQIQQLQALSSNYIESQNISKGINSLQQAYELAIKQGHTLEAKKSMELLVSQYRIENKNKKAFEIYADFMTRLEPLIKADSSLIDDKFFLIHEKRISQLEKERALKDELIKKKNTFNSVLQGFIVFILIFLLLMLRAWYSIKQKNKKIALQSLRREMNPHFIFNSLNSVNQFIAQNNELEANKYLSSYSRLMRNMMENSNKDFIPLSKESEQLKEYLDLEQMRFQEKFVYKAEIDDSLDTEIILVPNMLIQPQLENAIWHGLRYIDSGGLLTLTVKSEVDKLCVTIEDNGIGLTKSRKLKTKHQKEHHSRGLTNTYERIKLLNSLYACHITMDITEKVNENSGVIVVFRFPLKYK